MTFLVKNLSRAIVIGLLLPSIAFAQSAQWNLSQLSHSLGSGGVVPPSKGGTGLTTLTANDCLAVNSAGTAIVFQACGSGGGAVSSFSGDGTFATNSSSTGGVTLTLGNTGLAYGVWGGITGASGAPAYHSLSSYPAAAFPTLNQSTTGTSANVTATTNSTLTTLSALSLPQSQVTGLGTFATANAATPPAIGGTTPAAGAFTTLSASGTVSGAGFSTYLASPPAIGGTAPAAGSFTTLSASGQLTSTVTTGTAPLVVASTTQVANLQAATAGALATTGSNGTFWGVSGGIQGYYTPTAAASSVTPGTTTVVGATAPCLLDNSATTVMGCATLQGLAINGGVIGPSAANTTFTASHTVASTDMGGQVVMNVTGGGTLTIPAIGSGVFGAGQSLGVVNYSASTLAISTTPTVNAGGGCVTATGIPSGDSWQIISNGTTLDCIQTVSAAGGGSGTVTTTGTPASTYLAGFSGSTSITGTANATLSGGALTLGVSGTVGSIQLGNATSGTVTLNTVPGALGSVTASLPANTGTIAETNLAQSFASAQQTFGAFVDNLNGSASQPSLKIIGAPFTGGTGTTTMPLEYFVTSGSTAPTTLSTAGTYVGINTASGFTGNFEDYHVNGGASVFSVNYQGNILAGTYNGVTIPATASTALTSPTTTTAGQCQESTTTAGLGQWVACPGGGTVSDGAGTATANELLASTTTAHTYSVVSTLPTAAMPALTGDVTGSSGSLSITVTKIHGVTQGVTTLTSGTSGTPDCTFSINKVTVSTGTAFTINAPATCAPYDGQELRLEITSSASGAAAYTWNAIFIASATLALPTTANAASKEDEFEFEYSTSRAKWKFLASAQGF